MLPEVGASSPATSPSSVDLPLPDGPAIATVSPVAMSSETPSRTVSVRPPLGSRSVRSRIETSILVILHSDRGPASRAARRRPCLHCRHAAGARPTRVGGVGRQPAGRGGGRGEEAYPALLEARLRREGFDYRVVNAGVSGDTSAGGLRRLDWTLRLSPAVVI